MITRLLFTLVILLAFSVNAAVTNISSNIRAVSVNTNAVIVSPTNGPIVFPYGAAIGDLLITNLVSGDDMISLFGTNSYKMSLALPSSGSLTVKNTDGQYVFYVEQLGSVSIPFGSIGIGVSPSPLIALYGYKTFLDPSGSPYGIYINSPLYTTTNVTRNLSALRATIDLSYAASGTTNLGSIYGGYINAIIDNTNHQGRLGLLSGMRILHGIGSSGAGTVTTSRGLGIYGYRAAGTVDALWGIYETGDDKNYFGATASGFGTETPAARVAINGGLHVGGDSDPGDNNLLVDGSTYVSTALYTLAAVATNTISVGTITVNTNAVITGSSFTKATNFANVIMGTNYISADKSIGGTMTFTNYTHNSGGTSMVTNVWVFKNGLFITNTITQ